MRVCVCAEQDGIEISEAHIAASEIVENALDAVSEAAAVAQVSLYTHSLTRAETTRLRPSSDARPSM